MRKIRFGVVGCGHIGRRHIAVIEAESQAEMVAICDVDQQVLQKLSADYPQVISYTNYERMLAEAAIDIICICTPHGLHSIMSIQAAYAKKHILVEKPMALTCLESERMIQAAEENGVSLYVVKQNRYNAPILLTKRTLDEGRLGRVFMVQCNVMWNRHDAYYEQSPWRGKKHLEGGALQTQVSHFLDLLVWWFGNIQEAKTIIDTLNHDIEIEDCGVSALRFESGTIGSLLWTTCVYNVNYEGSITIIGEKGTIKIGGKYLNKIEFWDVMSYPMPEDIDFDDAPNQYGTYQGSSSNHDKLIHSLAEQIIDSRKGVVEGDEGLKTIQAIEKIYGQAEAK
ncbi:Gfo/Idh/MocA family protein [Tunicatimonas pelagia]|uniref:Gfo/Idh/MocA family protein n=1 Tax=Tunicatimonas pelagia TaxID=931531 RepID=UPI00266500D5|nr:Gfo/Idh/MocA family oxidoreductase [Tunicatimonas pelagia]WKN45153.1 Gfo/Idh/MocA family oxidoreductase [Tunicatimonas pelagia]